MPMVVVRMVVAYDGTRFHGFQRQTNNVNMMMRAVHKRPQYHNENGTKKHCSSVTIQEVLEHAFLHLYPNTTVQEMCLKFAGRTDKGVHARGQVIVITLPDETETSLMTATNSKNDDDKDKTERNGTTDNAETTTTSTTTNNKKLFSCWELCNAINNRLPVDVSVHKVQRIDKSNPNFHPRNDVKRKVYTYTIKYRRKRTSITSANDKNDRSNSGSNSAGPIRHAFDPPCMWVCPWALDDDSQIIPTLCEYLQGAHDYSNFVHKEDRSKKDQNLSLDKMTYEIMETHDEAFDNHNDNNSQAGITITICIGRFVFEAERFRRTMIRNLVGYCIDACRQLLENNRILPEISTVFQPNQETASRIHAAPASGLCLEAVEY